MLENESEPKFIQCEIPMMSLALSRFWVTCLTKSFTSCIGTINEYKALYSILQFAGWDAEPSTYICKREVKNILETSRYYWEGLVQNTA